MALPVSYRKQIFSILFDKVVQSLESAGLLQEDEMGRKVVEGENSK